jgi:hypothetical protein
VCYWRIHDAVVFGLSEELRLRAGLFSASTWTGCHPVTSGNPLISGESWCDREKKSPDVLPPDEEPLELTNGTVAAFLGEFGADCIDAMSCSGALGSRIPLDSTCGIWGD